MPIEGVCVSLSTGYRLDAMSSYDPIDIRGQERAKSEEDQRNKATRDTEESDLKWLVSTKRGRRIVWRQLDQAGVFRLSFNTNALQMAFSEGNRNSGNRLLALIHSQCPDIYSVMVKENTHDPRSNDDGN